MKLYSLKNNNSELFNPPFVALDDTDAKEVIRKAIISARDLTLLTELDAIELYHVGDFDVDNGFLIPYDHEMKLAQRAANDSVFDEAVAKLGAIKKVCDLSELKLPAHIQKAVDDLRNLTFGKSEDSAE